MDEAITQLAKERDSKIKGASCKEIDNLSEFLQQLYHTTDLKKRRESKSFQFKPFNVAKHYKYVAEDSPLIEEVSGPKDGFHGYEWTDLGTKWCKLLRAFIPEWIQFSLGGKKHKPQIAFSVDFALFVDWAVVRFPSGRFPKLPSGMQYEQDKGTWRILENGEFQDWYNNVVQTTLKHWGFNNIAQFNFGYKAFATFRSNSHVYHKYPKLPLSLMKRGLVAFKNGTYNFFTNEIQPHSKNDYLLNYHNYNLPDRKDENKHKGQTTETNAMLEEMLDPNVELGKYDNDKLAELAENNESVLCLKQYIGYMFFNSYKEVPNKLLILVGKKGNGKSTLINLVGDYYLDGIAITKKRDHSRDKEIAHHNDDPFSFDNVTPIDLLRMTDPKDRFIASTLYGMEMAYDADIGTDLLKSMARIKKLTGGDGLPAEFKGGRQFTLNAYAKLIFSANDLPPISGKQVDGALKDRAMVLPFFNKDTRTEDRGFWKRHNMDAVKNERSQFVYECIQCFRKVMTDGFTISPEIKKATEDWLDNNDTLKDWLYSIPDENPSLIDHTKRGIYFLPVKRAYCDFEIYCHQNNLKVYSKPTWKSELHNKLDFEGKSGNKLKRLRGVDGTKYSALTNQSLLSELDEMNPYKDKSKEDWPIREEKRPK